MPNDQLQWVSLSDFTPGIRHRPMEGGADSSPAPMGAATQENTYRCIALPTGGLGPLPKMADDVTKGAIEASASRVAGGEYHISGFHVTGPVLPVSGNAGDYGELHFAFEYVYDADDNGSFEQRRYLWQRWKGWEQFPDFDTIFSVNGAGGSAQEYRGTFFADHRVHATDPFEVGIPVVAAGWYAAGGGGTELFAVFPDPADPTTNSRDDISTTKAADKIVAHQGRLVLFEQVGHSHGANGSWSSDEQIYWTKVNLPTLQNSTASVFSQGQMTGYGAVASVSAQQLLCIKAKNGGYLVEGDLDNPTIVALPGLVGMGSARAVPIYSPVGLVYPVQAGGVYAWQGGDTSKLLSPQLNDDFWQTNAATNEGFINYNGKLDVSRDWVLVPNNWLYDCITESWWRIQNPDTVRIYHWATSPNARHIWGAPATYEDSGTPIAYLFDRQVAAGSYSWQSQPMPFTMDTLTQIRELIVVTAGVGTVDITITNESGTSETKQFTTTTTDKPQAQRTPFAIEGTHLQIRIESDGETADDPAPLVYEVRFGHQSHNRIAEAS